MYHLARSLYLQWTSKPEYSIILLGLDNAGKTTLMSQIRAMFNTTPASADVRRGATGDLAPSTTAGNTVPTVGQNVATIDLPDMYLKIWDVGGQLSLRRLWASYYRNAHAIVFIVDSTDLGSGEIDDGDVDGAGGDGAGGVGGLGGLGSDAISTVGRGWMGRRRSSNFGTAVGSVGAGAGPGAGAEPLRRQHSRSIEETLGQSPPAGDRALDQQQQELQPPAPASPATTATTPRTPWSPWTPIMASPRLAKTNGYHHHLHVQQGRLEECRAVLESVLSHHDTAGLPILVLANKQDREDCLEVVRIKEGFVRKVFEGDRGGMIRDSRVLPVSALKGTGVKEAVEWVKSRVLWNKEARPPVMR